MAVRIEGGPGLRGGGGLVGLGKLRGRRRAPRSPWGLQWCGAPTSDPREGPRRRAGGSCYSQRPYYYRVLKWEQAALGLRAEPEGAGEPGTWSCGVRRRAGPSGGRNAGRRGASGGGEGGTGGECGRKAV